MRTFSILAVLCLSVTVTSCESRKSEAASASTSAVMVAPTTSTPARAVSDNSATEVVKVVFIGKEHACDCTRKKVETASAALQQVLGTSATIPVEMLKVDTEEAKVEPYRQQKPMIAVPALYFLNAKGGVIDVLQGEIAPEQITRILKK